MATCQRCKTRPARRTKTRCAECARKDADYIRSKRDTGTCPCGAAVAPGRRSCAECLKVNRESKAREFMEAKREGRCAYRGHCQKVPAPGHVYCPKHLRKTNEACRRHYKRRQEAGA